MTGPPTPHREVQNLIDLISNSTDAYTTALFLAPGPERALTLYAYQSLSSSLNLNVSIGPGEGLIGWVHKSQKAVNVDKFDHDTRRLLLYKADESIKSFMAVPLPKINGVLSVDSKQRYVFTEKSQKIFNQFGQAVEMALDMRRQAASGLSMGRVVGFLSELGSTLEGEDKSAVAMRTVLSRIREFAGAAAAFLTVIVPGDPGKYFLAAQDGAGELKLPDENLPVKQGLAGWVMDRRKALILERATESDKSFIFIPDEPLRRLPAFAGWPLMWGGRLRGALLLAGNAPFAFDESSSQGLVLAADRLAAALEVEALLERIGEVSRLDAQAGLPHRTYFTKRLARMIKRASEQNRRIILHVLRLDGLEKTAVDWGQEAAQELLKASARFLLSHTGPGCELGHLSYGIMAIAALGRAETEAAQALNDLTDRLADPPPESAEGRAGITIRRVEVGYPRDGSAAEILILRGLASLADTPPAREG